MELPSRKIRTLCALAALLALSNCATTQETMQECRQAAYSFCDKTVGAKGAAPTGTGKADASNKNPAYQQCLEAQVGACGVR
jgi:hypothetical protein